MALSNWDTLAIDHNNKPINGSIKSKRGVEVEIYKNWIWIRDKTETHEIYSADLIYKDVVIHAERGPQNGIYCIVGTPVWPAENDKLNLMVGIGCYGFNDDRWIGVCKESVNHLARIIRENASSYLLNAYEEILSNIDLEQAQRYNQGDKYIADNLNINTPTSKVGEADNTIVIQMLKRK